MVYRRRPDLPYSKAQILAALDACRKAVIEMKAGIRPGSPAYVAGEAITKAIDDLASVLTGDREHFWVKPHGGSWGPLPDDRTPTV